MGPSAAISAAVKSASSTSSSAEPSCGTPAPPSVSSSASGSMPRVPGRYISRCRCTASLQLAANTRSLQLQIVSAAANYGHAECMQLLIDVGACKDARSKMMGIPRCFGRRVMTVNIVRLLSYCEVVGCMCIIRLATCVLIALLRVSIVSYVSDTNSINVSRHETSRAMHRHFAQLCNQTLIKVRIIQSL